MLNLKNTLDGYLKNVEVIGNTVQDENNLANIRSVGDKVEGQELYKIGVVSCGKNIYKHARKTQFVNGITYTFNDDGTIQASGTAVNYNGYLDLWRFPENNLPEGTYTFNGASGVNYNGKYFNCPATITISKNDNVRFYVTCGVGDTVNKVYKPQIEVNTQATSYELYQENKLEILSPVQLEKVGDVADRIICKDGVWGVEKNITTTYLTSAERWGENTTDLGFKYFLNKTLLSPDTSDRKIICNTLSVNDSFDQSYFNSYNQILVHKSSAYSNYLYITLDVDSVEDFKKWLDDNPTYIKYGTKSQFIPLPHDQQVKLRTFAGQTNIAFLTEIPGQIKAQVPKSLGATVNTHTEQIRSLNNELNRVKKLEESTVSTVTTESDFTTVEATSNGYFEDVKLEGKTLVNLIKNKSNWGGNTNVRYSTIYLNRNFEMNKIYTLCVVNPPTNFDNMMFRYDVDNTMFHSIKNTVTTFKLSNILEVSPVIYLYGENLGEDTNTQIIILEGDHTNNPPEYFEGLMSVGQDVEEVSVKSVNENLVDYMKFSKIQDADTAIMVNGELEIKRGAGTSVQGGVKYGVYLVANQKYRVQLHARGITGGHALGIALYNSADILDVSNRVFRDSSFNNEGILIKEFTVSNSGMYYLCFNLDGTDKSVWIKDVILSNTTKMYTPHQSNKKPLLYYNPTTETWEKPVLREWDTIEKHSDGKYYYHKRSEEVVLNGSEAWVQQGTNDALTLRCAFVKDNCLPGLIVCDRFSKLNIVGYSDIEGIFINTDKSINLFINKSKLSTQDVAGFKAWLKANPTKLVYQLVQEEVYECTNIDLMTYSKETNYIINSGAVSPKSLLKVHNNISNVVKILQEKVSLLENTFIAGLKSVLSGDMYSLATILYPEDFEQNDNTEQDIMVIPE